MKPVVVEGIPDAELMKLFGFTTKLITKEGSKGNVCNRLEKSQNTLGVVDEDPTSEGIPSYLKILEQKCEAHNLIHLFDSKRQNTVVMICPNLEEWLSKVVKDEKIDIKKDFGLPDTGKELHKVINREIPKFQKLIAHLITIQAAPLIHFKNLLSLD